MRVLGVTGGTGSGKSTVCKILAKNGGVIIDADNISKKLQKKGMKAYDEMVEHFGADMLLPSGEFDRRKLGKLVFENPKELAALNGIVHKYVACEIKSEVCKAKEGDAPFIVLDVPLPIEEGFFDTADCVWAVVANNDLRVSRLMNRSGISEAEAEARIAAQMSNREYEEIADVVIDNEEGPEELEKLVNYELQRFVSYLS